MAERLNGLFGIDPTSLEPGRVFGMEMPYIRPLGRDYGGETYFLNAFASALLVDMGAHSCGSSCRMLEARWDTPRRVEGGVIALGVSAEMVRNFLDQQSAVHTDLPRDQFVLGVAAWVEERGRYSIRYAGSDIGIWRRITSGGMMRDNIVVARIDPVTGDIVVVFK